MTLILKEDLAKVALKATKLQMLEVKCTTMF